MDELLDRRRNGLLWAVLAFALVLLIAGAVLSRWLAGPRVAAAELAFARVHRGSLTQVVRAYGEIRPEHEETVSAPSTGVVEALHVAPGTRVRKGDLLLTLSNEQLEGEYRRALQAARKARTELARGRAETKVELLRLRLSAVEYQVEAEAVERLLAAGGTSRVEVEKKKRLAELAARIVEEAREAGQAKVDALALAASEADEHARRLAERLARLEVRSRLDGLLQTWSDDLRPGVRVEYGQALARLSGGGGYRALLHVPVRHAHRVQPGMVVQIHLPRQETVRGKVVAIRPQTENDEIVLDVSIDDAGNSRLYPGQSVLADIVADTRSGALVVDPPAGVQAGATAWVFRLDREGRRLQRVLVTFGAIGREGIAVESGLTEGDEIVTTDMSDWVEHSGVSLQGQPAL